MSIVLKVENLSKLYELGEIGTGTISHDLNRWWARIRGKEDPYTTIGQTNDRTKKADSDFVWALKDINFEVSQGDVLGIIGKNGAGKSTLLKIISQITAPTKGSIKIKGRIAALLEVGTGMHPEMTARENIYLNGAILGMRKFEIDRKFDEIVDFSGCALYIDTPIKRFSSGMRVRLGFAVAAFLEPEILIVDEVLAVGDAEFQKKAIGKMQDVSKSEGRTVLFVSHNMAAVQNLCRTGILISNGTITYSGCIENVIEKYIDSATENMTSQNLMNRKDRKGSGELNFTQWDILDSMENKIHMGMSGKKIIIQLNYTSKKTIENVIFSLGIFSKKDKSFYATIRTDCIGKVYNIKEGNGVINFIFERLPFTEGTYIFNILSQTKENILDWILEAGEFSVLNGDFYSTGILPANGRQGVLLEFDSDINYL